MYCIKCGVELADSETVCPLCGTRVYHPDLDCEPKSPPLYPKKLGNDQTISRSGALFVVTFIFALGALLPMICNLSVNGSLTWSGYVIGAVLLAYVVVVLPMWFRKPNFAIFVPCDFAACALYLLYIDLITKGSWFLGFAFPVVGGTAAIFTAVVVLCKYVRRGYLYIFGGAIILTGAQMVLMEFLINKTFGFHEKLVWSIYPLAACLLIGILLIVIAICPKLRTTLHKKFFV